MCMRGRERALRLHERPLYVHAQDALLEEARLYSLWWNNLLYVLSFAFIAFYALRAVHTPYNFAVSGACCCCCCCDVLLCVLSALAWHPLVVAAAGVLRRVGFARGFVCRCVRMLYAKGTHVCPCVRVRTLVWARTGVGHPCLGAGVAAGHQLSGGSRRAVNVPCRTLALALSSLARAQV